MDPVTMALVGLASNPAVQGAAVDAVGELSPEAAAQRRAYDRARKRLDTGVGYGFSDAQKNTMATQGNQAVASQLQAQQALLARQQAAGQNVVAGQRAVAQAAAAGAAQNAANIQAQSNDEARNQFAQDTARVDAQADLARNVWRRQSDRLYESGGLSLPGMGGDVEMARKVAGANVQSANRTIGRTE